MVRSFVGISSRSVFVVLLCFIVSVVSVLVFISIGSLRRWSIDGGEGGCVFLWRIFVIVECGCVDGG